MEFEFYISVKHFWARSIIVNNIPLGGLFSCYNHTLTVSKEFVVGISDRTNDCFMVK